MSKTIKRIILSIFLICTPFYIVLAQNSTNVTQGITTLGSLIDTFTTTVVKSLATLFMSLAVVAFLYGIAKYIWGMREGKAEEVKNGNQFMTWGLVALFIMFSVYGIIKLGQGIFFNGADVTTITIPNINFKAGTSANILNGGSNNNTYSNNSIPSVGTTIKSVNGTILGTVNTSGQIVNSAGNVVGTISGNGQITDNSGNTISTQTDETNHSNDSMALSEYIKQCKAQDPTKTGTQCWQEYSAQNPSQATTVTTPVDTNASVNGSTAVCGNDPIHNSNDVPYEDVTQDECSAKCSSTCYSFCSGQKGCGMWGCWACPSGSSNQNNTSNQSECSTNSDCGSGMECTNSRCYIDMGQMTHSECTDATTEDSCSTLGSRCQWTSAGTCVDAGL